MPSNKDFDDIPTLSDIVFPGNPEKIIANKTPESSANTPSELKDSKAVHHNVLESKNTYIQEEIDNIVEGVLAKYFFKIRKEVVEEIMQELHKKTP